MDNNGLVSVAGRGLELNKIAKAPFPTDSCSNNDSSISSGSNSGMSKDSSEPLQVRENEHPTQWKLNQINSPIESVEMRAHYVRLGHNNVLEVVLRPVVSPMMDDFEDLDQFESNVIHRIWCLP